MFIAAHRPEPADDGQPASTPWHALPVDEVLSRCQTSAEGLSPGAAAEWLREHGPNRLPVAETRGPLLRFLAQFHNLLIYVLLGSATVTALLGQAVDTAVILGVVVLNAVVGFVQEGRAEQALDAIRSMLTPRASVTRGGRRLTLDAADLVPGDLVLLESGDRVPADLRLVRVRALQIDEAILTGESMAVEKSPASVAPGAALGDRTSVAFSGTLVTAGSGAGVVVATGVATEIGQISALLGTVQPLTTPLLRQINSLARRLTIVILAASALVVAFAVFVHGYPVADAFMAAIGMAVALIPEGLPAVLTITLAIGVQRMAARNAIVRRLPAVETLGSVSTICSDKTGTLTRNEMTVRTVAVDGDVVEVTGTGYEPRGVFRRAGRDLDPAEQTALLELTRAALLCNDAALRPSDAGGWLVDGDPMEGALVALAAKAGHDATLVRKQYPRLDEIPFDAQHRFMATVHHGHDGSAFICLKGAPERVIEICDRCTGHGGESQPLERGVWAGYADALASQGQRVLAIATKSMPAGTRELTFADVETGFALIGLLGLDDPPREEVVAAVRDCRSAGIRIKMITGDHAATARTVARLLGLENDRDVLTGQDLDALDEGSLRHAVRTMDVFARTSPEHKLRLVRALQADGAVVAMTGDGVNDAPALKQADIGIAMGRRGAEAAKEAAEMVLADDNFASIVAAVREGRTVYDNLRKVIAWTLPTNVGEAATIMAAVFLGLTLPLTPVQILWVNLVTAVTLGLTLAFEPTEPDVMTRAPRRAREPILSGFLLWRTVLVSVVFVAGAFGLFAWASERGLPVDEARTIVVNAIVVMEIAYLFSVRYLRLTSLTWQGVLGTPAVWIGVGASTALQFAFTYAPPMQALFGTRPVELSDGLAIVALGAGLLVVLEAEKLVRRRWGLGAAGA